MTNRFFSMISVAMLAGISATAEPQGGLRMEAEIPFDFQAGPKTMPAGSYVVREIGPNVISVQNADSYSAVTLVTFSKGAKLGVRGTLRFNRYGNHHFLASVDRPDGRGYQLPSNKVERELAKSLGNAPAGQTLVAAKQ